MGKSTHVGQKGTSDICSINTIKSKQSERCCLCSCVVASWWGPMSPLALRHHFPILPNCCKAFASCSLAGFDAQLCETSLDPSS